MAPCSLLSCLYFPLPSECELIAVLDLPSPLFGEGLGSLDLGIYDLIHNSREDRKGNTLLRSAYPRPRGGHGRWHLKSGAGVAKCLTLPRS